ncbi:hypothetical protein WJX73_005358 [Symbiochloris irregularis]|uniref:Chloride channel protein n=1 Tax=Symbiochloris irregularis TaxID=706552 RepID=A0AAW1PA62_9CHLO
MSDMDDSARESLLPSFGKVMSPKKLDSATEALTTRVDRVKKAVQSRRDAPSTLIGCAVFFGVLSGLVAYVYSAYFETMLWLMWEHIPLKLVQPRLENMHAMYDWFPAVQKVAWLYTLTISTVFGGLVGITQRYMGTPGDLPDTVSNVHKRGYIPIKQAPSMFICSSFSISAGGSLGPEAALLALCGATTSWVARKVFGFTGHRLRNMTLLGMTAGLAAFFGVALGGSLFALEVLHRTGMQFFEVTTYAVCCGVVCLAVFRGLAQKPFGDVWIFKQSLLIVDWRHIVYGALMGCIAAAVALYFMTTHKYVKRLFHKLGLHEHKAPVSCGFVGGFLVGLIGILLPPTMFWGEYEINTLADQSRPLPHIWPRGGIYGLDVFWGSTDYPWWLCLLICFTKLLAISITVLSGFRGGFIFPTFFAGVAFGQAAWLGTRQIAFLKDLPPVLPCMTIAAGLETAITRTPLSTTLILANLSGHTGVIVPCLASALTSLFLTLHKPFIASQQDRSDIDLKDLEELLERDGHSILIDRSQHGTMHAHFGSQDLRVSSGHDEERQMAIDGREFRHDNAQSNGH